MHIDGIPAVDATIKAAENGNSICSWQVPLTREMIGGRVWSLRLEDNHGFVSWPREYTIRALRDQGPEVKIIQPLAKKLKMKSTDSLPLSYLATDDYGIAKAELLTTTDGKERIPLEWEVPESLDPGHIEGNQPFNLSDFDLSGIRVLTLRVRVTDNLPEKLEGPHTALSEIITITIDEDAESYFEKQAAKDYESIRAALEEVLADLQQTNTLTTPLQETVKTDDPLAKEVTDKIDQVRQQAAATQEKLTDLGDALPSTAFQALQPEVVDLADSDVNSIADRAGQIKLVDDAEQRLAHSEAADEHTGKAVERTEALIAELDKMWERIQRLEDLKELAAEQERLSELAQSLEEEQNQSPEDLAKQQKELNEQIAEALKKISRDLRGFCQSTAETGRRIG